jgi:hypothetical protein
MTTEAQRRDEDHGGGAGFITLVLCASVPLWFNIIALFHVKHVRPCRVHPAFDIVLRHS